VALLLASQLYVWINLWPLTIGWGEAFLWSLPQLLAWGFLIPAVLELGARFPVEGRESLARVMLHGALSVVLAFGALLALDLSDRLLHWTTLMGAPQKLVSDVRLTVVHLHVGIGIYWATLAIQHALRFRAESVERRLRASRLETELARAQLQALQAQMNPHFLFNTLNSIAVLMRRDVEAAERMLERLADLLEIAVRQRHRQTVPLEEELRTLRAYLEIEETRFPERLEVRFEIEPEVRHAPVPALLLQPLAENAVRHGLTPLDRGGTITVAARDADDGRLEISIRDDGAGIPEAGIPEERLGVGLENTRSRLEALYGDDAGMTVRRTEEGGTEVLLRIPGSRSRTGRKVGR